MVLQTDFYTHRADDSSQEPDPCPGNYYCSVADHGRFSLLLGPFRSHAHALAMVRAVTDKARHLDPKSAFYSFGTVRMKDDFTKPGLLNSHLPDAEGLQNE